MRDLHAVFKLGTAVVHTRRREVGWVEAPQPGDCGFAFVKTNPLVAVVLLVLCDRVGDGDVHLVIVFVLSATSLVLVLSNRVFTRTPLSL